MHSNYNLKKPYPNEKNPFHEEDTSKKPSKNRIQRTFSSFRKKLSRIGSIRRKPDAQIPEKSLNYGTSTHNTLNGSEEEFILRTRIPERCGQTPETPRRATTTTLGRLSPSSPSAGERTCSMQNISSTNPFEDEITPLFHDETRSVSRHTLNLPPTSSESMRGSSESINTLSGRRRRKRSAPKPPQRTSSIEQRRNASPSVEPPWEAVEQPLEENSASNDIASAELLAIANQISALLSSNQEVVVVVTEEGHVNEAQEQLEIVGSDNQEEVTAQVGNTDISSNSQGTDSTTDSKPPTVDSRTSDDNGTVTENDITVAENTVQMSETRNEEQLRCVEEEYVTSSNIVFKYTADCERGSPRKFQTSDTKADLQYSDESGSNIPIITDKDNLTKTDLDVNSNLDINCNIECGRVSVASLRRTFDNMQVKQFIDDDRDDVLEIELSESCDNGTAPEPKIRMKRLTKDELMNNTNHEVDIV